MKFASLTDRIAPKESSHGNPWEVHELAMAKVDNGEQITLLSIGQETDETTPAAIVDSAIASLRNGDHHYTDVRGTSELRDAIARYHTRLTGQSVSGEQCTVYSGAQNSLFAVALTLLEPGCEVIVTDPYYTTYEATFGATGATVIKVPLNVDNNYQLDIAAIESKFSSSTRMLVLNSPNNPMGDCYSLEQFEKLVALCKQHNCWLVLDMVYLDIVDREQVAVPHGIPDAEPLLISICSLSKSHRMTGWRLGWVVGPLALANHLANLSVAMHYGLPPFIMAAAKTAIDQASDTPRIVENMLQRRRQIVQSVLQPLAKGHLVDSGHGMFILLDVSALNMNAKEFALHLLSHFSVAVLPCSGFGPTGEYLVRIGLCVDDSKLENACLQIKQCVKSLANQNQ